MANKTSKGQGKGKGKGKKSSPLTFLSCGLWLAAAGATVYLLREWTPAARAVFAPGALQQPLLTQWTLPAGEWLLDATQNLLMVVGAIAVTLLPYLLGMRGKAGLRLYAGLMVVGLLAVGGVWLGLKHPAGDAILTLQPEPPR